MFRPSSPISREYVARRPGFTPVAGAGSLGPNLLTAPNGPFTSGNWSTNAAGALTETTGQVDPLGGTTASLMTDTAATAIHSFVQNLTAVAGVSYFVTSFFKPGTFATGVDIDMAATNGGGTVHISNAGAFTNLTPAAITGLSSTSVGGFFKSTWTWKAPSAGTGQFTVSFGVGTDNAPLSYLGTVQNHTFWGLSVQRINP